MPPIALSPADPPALARALACEFLLTNSLGAFAMGTLADIPARRYHGLLIAPLRPPVQRILALHSLLAWFQTPLARIPLSSYLFSPDRVLHPPGVHTLHSFNQHSPSSASHTWSLPAHQLSITRTLSLAPSLNRLTVRYSIHGRPPAHAALLLRPFTPLRDFHSLSRAGHSVPALHVTSPDHFSLSTNAAILSIAHPSSSFTPDPQHWNNFAYPIELDRGQDWLEDLYSPGSLHWPLQPLAQQHLDLTFDLAPAASTTASAPPLNLNWSLSQPASASTPLHRLRDAASQFIVTRIVRNQPFASIIAGYPWFSDWGRDTMIALPGLLLSTNRLHLARSVLELFARHLSPLGLIPNCFDDYDGPPHYNTVDASLWFIHAVHQFLLAQRAATPPSPAVAPPSPADTLLLDACRTIIAAYSRTAPSADSFNIHLTPDHLLSAGDPSTQLTWMDAKRDGIAFTPRHGKAVEINALYYNALLAFADLTFDHVEALDLRRRADLTAAAFRAAFWSPHHSCLHDCLNPENQHTPADLLRGGGRPNQVFALSLPFSPLSSAQQKSTLDYLTRHLLTPFGLRTLHPADPAFRPRYAGDPWQRDSAYHQGTVWPWLIGPYADAYLRVHNSAPSANSHVRSLLQPLLDSMLPQLHFDPLSQPPASLGCINQLAEIYDATAPQFPHGCPAQAWSVAEVLRILTILESP